MDFRSVGFTQPRMPDARRGLSVAGRVLGVFNKILGILILGM